MKQNERGHSFIVHKNSKLNTRYSSICLGNMNIFKWAKQLKLRK